MNTDLMGILRHVHEWERRRYTRQRVEELRRSFVEVSNVSRGNPPELPSLKHPEWLTNLLRAFANQPDLALKFLRQYGAQVQFERAALAANPIAVAAQGASVAEQYEHYRRIIETTGFKLDPYGRTVLALRGISSDGLSHATGSTRSYDDTLVVLTRDANGDPQVRVFEGSTHPGQTTANVGGSTGAPDHQADVGIIIQGEYDLVPRGNHNGAAAWDVRLENSGVLPGYRDTNHDGEFSDAERTASEARDDTLTGVMIHQGAATTPQSLGCLNLSSDRYSDFIKAIGGASEGGKLIILDADEAWRT